MPADADTTAALSERLHAFLARYGWSRNAFAIRAGIHSARVSTVARNDASRVSPALVHAMTDALDRLEAAAEEAAAERREDAQEAQLAGTPLPQLVLDATPTGNAEAVIAALIAAARGRTDVLAVCVPGADHLAMLGISGRGSWILATSAGLGGLPADRPVFVRGPDPREAMRRVLRSVHFRAENQPREAKVMTYQAATLAVVGEVGGRGFRLALRQPDHAAVVA